MSRLVLDTLKFFGRFAQKMWLYTYAQRVDVRQGTGLLHALFTGRTGKNTGARFLSETEQLKILSPSNKGLLVNGKNKRLNLEDSFKHLLVVAPTGTGKTSKFVIPNVLELAQNENSIIVTDPSGEIFAQTSGYLQSKGFTVLKFDPTDPEHSIYFNPLRYIFSYSNGRTDIDPVKVSLLATSLASSSLKDPQDSFWKAGVESLVEFFTYCLRGTPKDYHNLYNVYKLAEAMTPDGCLLDNFMVNYVHEQRLKDKWLSIISNSNPTIQSQIASTQTALKPLANERLAKILSKNSIRFSDFKKEKTILYLTFPVNEASVYTFVLNLFYTLLFHYYMEVIPQKEDLPLFILYDEFGHANIPDFDIVITNMRKYKVSLSLVLQSFSQLETQYGQEKANTIIEGGVNSKLFFSGTSQKTAQAIERMLGRVIRQESYHTDRNETITNRNEFNLLNADEIRTLQDNQALLLTGNKSPILLDILPYFKNSKFKSKPNFGEAHITANSYHKYELHSILNEV
ncbi:MAG: type IV secretory system conjugative DNA transfer family protein [Candidatus Peribacteria bacterium]|jgi:type IV secretory pathway TraG/TraD family ATPase VirD4|nr:type IV secretory system conjugative DNA transfer family protein [Candidatus Peribacteria bacterium]